MTAAPTHRVLRVELTLHANHGADVPALQAAMRQLLLRDWLPCIDAACTRLGRPGHVQRIDRLELDLGLLPGPALLAATRAPAASSSVAGLAGLGGAADAPLQAMVHTRLSQALQSAAEVDSDLELVASALHTGVLPWWADPSDRAALQRALRALLRGPALDWAALLASADGPAGSTGAPAPAIGRLVAALQDAPGAAADAGPLATLAQWLDAAPAAGRRGAWPAALHQAWLSVLGQAAPALGLPLPTLHGAWWPAAVVAALAAGQGGGSVAPARWLAPALHGTARALGVAPPRLGAVLRRAADRAGAAAPGAVVAALAPLWAVLERWDAPAGAGPAAGTPGRALSGGAAVSASGQDRSLASPVPQPDPTGGGLVGLNGPARPPGETSPGRRAAQVAAAVQQAGAAPALYIANAGLVWLWPFLPTFFDRMGLRHDGRWTSPQAPWRAALLLQCTASGDVDPPEFQLPLNKLLCGLPLDAAPPLGSDAIAPISLAEQDGCEALLVATIARAPILREMSVAGFRGTFLLRSGQLSARDGQALLRVERQTYDLVLDRFPWSAGLVRLPWMPGLLQVEW